MESRTRASRKSGRITRLPTTTSISRKTKLSSVVSRLGAIAASLNRLPTVTSSRSREASANRSREVTSRRSGDVTFTLAGAFFRVALLGLLLAGTAPALQAQGTASPADTASLIVRDVAFAGNEFFSDQELSVRVRTQPNRRFLGIPGLTWWLWLYELGESGALGERVGEALMRGGEPPAFLDQGVLASDAERLRLLYRQEGFRDASLDVEVDTLSNRRADILFQIAPGSPTFIRNVTFEGADHLTADQKLRLARGTLLRSEVVGRERPLTFRADDQRYSEPTLLEERRRLLTFLRNEGYAAVTRDSIRALVFPATADSFDITLRIGTGPRFRFGDLEYLVTGPEPEAVTRLDTIAFRAPSDTVAGGRALFVFEDESRLSPGLLTRTLQFRPGEWYDQSDVLATKRRLDGSGVFLFTDIVPLPEDTASVQAPGPPRLPHQFELRTRRRHQIRLETFMLQRSGVIGGSDTELGTGAGITYENANLLGRGETFQLRTTGSISADIESTLLTGAQAEIVGSLTYPYLIWPFRFLERTLSLYDARTRASLSLLTARHDRLGLIIRGRGNARYRLEMRHNPRLISLLDVLDLSLSNPDTLDNFQSERFFDPITDPVQRAQIIEDYTLPQINTALRYTLRSANVNPLRRDRGYSYEAVAELGNNLPYLLDRYVYSPDTLEGSLPGLPIFREEGSPSRLTYRRYVRFVGDVRQYRALGGRSVLALKFFTGYAHPIGASNVVPFDRRFYAGGASSVRGWGLRDLGPGGARFVPTDDGESTTGEVTNILGGDVKIEAAVEVRDVLLRSLLAADWIGVLFLDAGNVWFGPRNPGFGEDLPQSDNGRFEIGSFFREVGVGSGLGIRTAWEYLILRLDFGVKVYDPTRTEQGFLPDGLDDVHLHFGIGHAF